MSELTNNQSTVLPDRGKRLNRQTFTTSRLLEFCSQKELVLQTGHPVDQWPLVVLKELVDNALDACEEAGIPPATVEAMLDFSVRVSSREAYASPTRGAQGNALKTLVAMPFALDGTVGRTIIEACGVRHEITFSVDSIRQEPKVEHSKGASDVRNGTSVTVKWPELACSQLASAKSRFLQIAEDYTWLNPHLSLSIQWDSERWEIRATDPGWRKWLPSDPTSAHWYDASRFERLAGAYVADDEDSGRTTRTVRDFISEFRGLSGSAKQKTVLDAAGMARLALAELFEDKDRIGKLLAAMKGATKPVKPQGLGVIGKEHLTAKFVAAGAELETINYKCTPRDDDGIPAVIEIAFGYCPEGPPIRRIITGVNWSAGVNDPFKGLGPYSQSLDGVMQNLRAGRNEPIIMFVHLTCPRIAYTDRGKGSLVLNGEITERSDDE